MKCSTKTTNNLSKKLCAWCYKEVGWVAAWKTDKDVWILCPDCGNTVLDSRLPYEVR